jgi:hypothetical protein
MTGSERRTRRGLALKRRWAMRSRSVVVAGTDECQGVEMLIWSSLGQTALAAFGYRTTLQLVQLVTHRLTGFLPHTALILLTSPSQVQVTARYLNADTSRHPNCTDQEEEEIRIKALKEQKRIMLDQSTAALGSATQGLAVDAGCTWIWLMVDTIRMDRQWYGNVRDIWLEEETAEMVIEVSHLGFLSCSHRR